MTEQLTKTRLTESVLQKYNQLPLNLQKVVFTALSALDKQFSSEEMAALLPMLAQETRLSWHANYTNIMNRRSCWKERPGITIEDEMKQASERYVKAMAKALDAVQLNPHSQEQETTDNPS